MKRHGAILRLSRWLVWLGRHEAATLISLAAVAAALWAFASLAGEVLEGDTEAVDRQILLMLRNPNDVTDPRGPRWLEETMRDYTALGGVGVLTFVTLAVMGFLALQPKVKAMLLVLVAVAGGLALSMILKQFFSRARPDLVPHGSYVYTSSFPSGHSMMAATTYLTLGALLARVERKRRIKAYLLIVAVMLTMVVGISRVYLGVHWPTDVLAGWTGGAAWALFCWTIALRLQASGQVETAYDTTGDA